MTGCRRYYIKTWSCSISHNSNLTSPEEKKKKRGKMGSFVVQFPSKLRNFTVWASPNNGKISTLIHSFIQSHICFTFSSVSMGFLGGFHFSGVPFDSPQSRGPVILELPLDKIRRPLLRTRSNDPEKVKELMESIREIGLQVPVTANLLASELWNFILFYVFFRNLLLGF